MSVDVFLLSFNPSWGDVVMVANSLFLPFTNGTMGEASHRGATIFFQVTLLVTTGAEVIVIDDDGVIDQVSN